MNCIVCGEPVVGEGWVHPDDKCQEAFMDAGYEFLSPESNAEPCACDEECWRYFMQEMYGGNEAAWL